MTVPSEELQTCPTASPLFIGGTGRCGTTVLARLVSQHSRYALVPIEVRFHTDRGGLPDLISGRTGMRTFLDRMRGHWFFREVSGGETRGLHKIVDVANLETALMRFTHEFDSDPFKAGARLMCELLDPLARAAYKPGWLEMTPPTVSAAPLLHSMFPEMKLIHIVRDGRDVASSVAPLDWGPDTPEEAVTWWAEGLRRADEAVSQIPDDQILVLHFEELVRDCRDESYAGLLDFLEIDDEPAMRQYFQHTLTQGRAHLGRWAEDPSIRDRDAFEVHYGQVVNRLHEEGVACAP